MTKIETLVPAVISQDGAGPVVVSRCDFLDLDQNEQSRALLTKPFHLKTWTKKSILSKSCPARPQYQNFFTEPIKSESRVYLKHFANDLACCHNFVSCCLIRPTLWLIYGLDLSYSFWDSRRDLLRRTKAFAWQQLFKGATHPDLFHFVEVQLDQLVLHSTHQHMAGPGVVDHAVHVHPGI